jgi:hypothetical protein
MAAPAMAEPSAAGPPAAALEKPEQPSPGDDKIESDLAASLDDKGSGDFFVDFTERADLSAATGITDWAERGTAVVKALKATAEASQAEHRAAGLRAVDADPTRPDGTGADPAQRPNIVNNSWAAPAAWTGSATRSTRGARRASSPPSRPATAVRPVRRRGLPATTSRPSPPEPSTSTTPLLRSPAAAAPAA